MSDAEVGTCDLCGQELIRTPNDCWHPYTVERACPPEPRTKPFDAEGWRRFAHAGLRPGRPGREHWQPGDIAALRD